MAKDDNAIYLPTRTEWRAWLEENHATSSGVWLIHYKKHTGKPSLPYDDAVEEALCFGWIDSIMKRIDEDRYRQKYSPRTNNLNWSDLNKHRVARLIKKGKMTPAGMAKVTFEITPELDEKPAPRSAKGMPVPDDIRAAFEAAPPAWENFSGLAPSYQRQYIGWITSAKREETRQKRIQAAIERLVQNLKLGLM